MDHIYSIAAIFNKGCVTTPDANSCKNKWYYTSKNNRLDPRYSKDITEIRRSDKRKNMGMCVIGVL